ncbi:MAG: hypothetical protein LPK58_07945 [Gammaproteobacteria bacterium]|nr:hypothetical protein [Chromatiales bacterium]MDX5333964.1 hypothetical protein [Gammaproteobacteria bacterium]MDX5375475.1 hypothetical protein [Gammaproteobacteria bacterium]
MDITSRIIEARGSDTIVDIRPAKVASVEEAAAQFGLFDSPGIYFEISEQDAVSVLKTVLSRDMAYHVELMPQNEADGLAKEFVRHFSGDKPKYFTNGDYGCPRKHPNVGPSWTPATIATFDTGVLVITTERIGCAWFTDED